MTTGRALDIVRRFAGARVLIVGDIMLDQFLVGRVERISPEAPVPVVVFDRDEFRLGGAANVAHGVAALGGRALLAGVIGGDAAGETLLAELRAAGIGTETIVRHPVRPTTRKLRIVTTRNQQVARVDYETEEDLDAAAEEGLRTAVEQAAAGADVIVISDYLKGTVTRTLAAAVVAAGTSRGIPVLVDPKIPHLDYYAGASLVTPNHHEAETAAQIRIRTTADVRRAARAIRTRVACGSVLITRGEHGMWLLDGSRQAADPEHDLPAAAREVADVTGAGDTVIATIALALAAGAQLAEAARLANYAAGVSVGKFGPAVVRPDELAAAVSAGSVASP